MTRAFRFAVAAILVVGAAVRLVQWSRGPSLRQDEIKLALNIGMRAPLELAQPLDHEQLAPVPFLWAAKGAAAVAGMTERALRLPSLLASLLLLVLMVPLSTRLLRPPAALIALGLVATSPYLIPYSNEFKQYEVEAMITVAVLLLLLWNAGPMRAVVVGAAAATMAVCAPFILPVPVALAAARARRPRMAVVAATAAWCAVFGALYLLLYREVATMPYMVRFWRGATLAPSGGSSLRLLGVHGWETAVLMLPAALATAAILAAGAAGIARRVGRARAAALVAPLLLVAGASVLGRYPLVGRTTLFTMPLFALLAAEGLSMALRPLGRAAPATFLTLGGAACVLQAALAFPRALRPTPRRIREYVASLRARLQPGDALYVSARSVEPWLYYTTDWTQPDVARYRWLTEIGSTRGPAHENAPGRGHPVIHEGDALVSLWHGVRVLVGVTSGANMIMPGDLEQRSPDPGFFDNELRRLRGLRGGTLWVLHYNDFERAHRDLGAGLDAIFPPRRGHEKGKETELSSWSLPAQ